MHNHCCLYFQLRYKQFHGIYFTFCSVSGENNTVHKDPKNSEISHFTNALLLLLALG